MLRILFPVIAKRYESSPFHDELRGFCTWLQQAGYARYTTGRHLRRLFQVLTQHRLPDEGAIAADALHRAFGRHCISPTRSRSFRGTEWAYSQFLRSQGRLLVGRPAPNEISEVCDRYRAYLVEVRGFARNTVAGQLVTASEFLRTSLRHRCSISDLRRAHVDRYLAKKSTELTRPSLRQTVGHLRGFLRFAAARGLLMERLDVIDTPRVYRDELPPRALPWNLVLNLLRSVDRSGKGGHRDYLILHLMAYYGLRASEIAGLRVDSIDWLAKTARIEQRKNHTDLVLPLSAQTMSLLRRYVRQARGADPRSSLFLRVTPPSGPMTFQAVCEVFYRWAARSDLPLAGYSSYCLRHSFAMRLLQRGVGVKAIGDLLGHKSMEATCWYLRLDTDALRPVGLPLPEGR